MTVSTTTSRADYTGNGVTTAFAVPFYFLDNTHLTVLRTQISTGAVTTLALTTDYTVTGAGVGAGGTVTMVTAPTTDQKLSILRNVPLTQLVHYVPNDPFPAATHEQALDQLTMEMQQVGEIAGRALQLPANTPSSGVSTSLPYPSSNKLIGWNSTATGLQNVDQATLATIVAFGTAKYDLFSGNGSTTAFTLTANPGALANLDVSISGISQRHGIDFIWTSGTTITFTSAPPSGTNNVLVRYLQGLPQGTSDSASAAFIASGTGAVTRVAQDKLREFVSVKDFGAVGDGVTDDTVAIQAAINYGAPLNVPIIFPAGTYKVTPGTSQVGAATYNTALVMLSNMHVIGQRGATIKIADNYSTDASPKELAIFSTVAHLTNVTFEGITFDLNGANNKMSPSRPTTYNQFNHAAIIANGPTGYMDDVLISGCTFKNCAGVCFIVTALVATGTTPTLGLRWKIVNNYFLNGGLDTNDHTSVYAWAEDVLCEGNTFWEDSPPHTVGKTGGATCYEVHGSNQRFVNNYCYNYTLGAYVAPNFTNTTLNTIVKGNHFYCSDYGILLWRGVALGYKEIDGVLIDGNTFYFDSYTYAGQPTYRAAVAYQGQIATAQGAINNVKICNNYAWNTGTTLLSQFVRWDTSTTASQTCSNLSVTDNQVIGFTDGFYLITNSANGQGLTEVSRNQFIALTPDAPLGNQPHGIYINSGGGIGVKTLVINDNQFIDERGSPQMNFGIYFTSGLITDLSLGNQTFKGMASANCYNAGAATITRSIGTAATFGANNVADGGTISFNNDFPGFTPKAIVVTGSVAGEFVSVTTFGANTFTVAIKKWTGGVLTAGTFQTVYWQVKF